ncbi:hypothetical protein [Actinomadura miaoliensis]|uniref:Phospholipid carrier-dependent glycosyltransferase n=1 Tax=Actinomadura miaoliensis TaxID=430685 RepID=A0ABP7WP21_9ACTN
MTAAPETPETTTRRTEPDGDEPQPPDASPASRTRALAGRVRALSWRQAGPWTLRTGRRAAGAAARGTVRAGRALRPSAVWASARRHPAFAVLLATAALLRVVTMIGYQPVMFFNDSFDYLHVAMKPYPHPLRPDGYSFMLLALKPLHSFALVAAVQHLMGLAMGVMIYALLRHRFRLPGWGAALAAAPPLLDAYTIQLEHLVLSDTLFTFLVVCTVTLLLWRDRPTPKVAAAVGLLIGMAWLTRSVGLPVLLGVLVFLLIRRTGWRLMAVMLAACMLPVVAYMGWFKAEYGKFAITESNGIFLYARVYKFADCHKINPPVQEMPLCTEPENRLPNSQDGIWNAASPLNRYPGLRFSPEQNATANEFSRRAILSQPLDYLGVVAHDFFRVFRWERTVFPDRATYQQYEFGETSTALPNWRMDNDTTAADEAVAYERGRARPRVVEPFAGVIRGYQDVFYLRGAMVGVILLVGLAGLGAMWRRVGGAAFLPWTLATGLLLAPAATAEFDYRYVLPSVPLACLAAGLAFAPEARSRLAGLVRRRGAEPAERTETELIEEKVPEVAAK